MIDREAIEQRIQALERQRDQLLANAQRQIGEVDGAIAALRQILEGAFDERENGKDGDNKGD